MVSPKKKLVVGGIVALIAAVPTVAFATTSPESSGQPVVVAPTASSPTVPAAAVGPASSSDSPKLTGDSPKLTDAPSSAPVPAAETRPAQSSPRVLEAGRPSASAASTGNAAEPSVTP